MYVGRKAGDLGGGGGVWHVVHLIINTELIDTNRNIRP